MLGELTFSNSDDSVSILNVEKPRFRTVMKYANGQLISDGLKVFPQV